MDVMNRSLLEFASTDAFVLLFLTGGIDPSAARRPTVTTVFHKDFDPEIVEMVSDSNTVTGELPTSISCTNFTFRVNQDGDLHSLDSSPFRIGEASFKADRLDLNWKKSIPDPNSKVPNPVLQLVG